MGAAIPPDIQHLFATCLWREASGEGVEGMRAVAWVIWNRTQRWGQSIYHVIMAPNQFTSMTVDPHPRVPEPDDLQMAEAQTIVSDLVTGRDTVDPTLGACYYANLAEATSGWFWQHIVKNTVEHPQTAVIGKHVFYK